MQTIKELRTAQKLSQAAFAKSIGVSAASVAYYEKGEKNPSEKVLAKIKEVYGVEVKLPKEVSEPETKQVPKTKAAKTEKKAAEVKTEAAKPVVLIQSAFGGEITPEEIIAKVGAAEHIYVRVDENRAYWVNGEESGFVELW
ncbi:MAG: helix-turn-helix transcriptional regulator [Clostridia bacterium]|nr:helix-turn-helix transcriptional regulator [Clostridia bacterium]